MSLVLMAPVFAQVVTGTAVERLAGFARAEHFNVAPLDLRPIPANTNLAPSYSVSARSGNVGASFMCSVTQGMPLEFFLAAGATADVRNTAGGADVATSADVVLGLTATQPARGVLTVEAYTPPSQGWPACAFFAVDVGDDGSIDFRSDCTISGYYVYRDYALTLPAGESRVRVTHNGLLNPPVGWIGEYSGYCRVAWIPMTGVARTYQPPCSGNLFTLTVEHDFDGGFLVYGPGPRQNAWLLFGTVQQAVTLQLPPHCVLATDIMTFLPWSDPMRFPWMPLPPGFALNVQGVWFAGPLQTLTSNALRISVP